MPRLLFIATRINGVESYHFVGIPNVLSISPAEGGAYDVGILRFPDRRSAVQDVFATASYLLEKSSC